MYDYFHWKFFYKYDFWRVCMKDLSLYISKTIYIYIYWRALYQLQWFKIPFIMCLPMFWLVSAIIFFKIFL